MSIEQLCSGCGGCGAWGPGFEKLFLAVDEGVYVVWSQFDVVAVSDGVGGASVNAVAAEDASRVVDVVDARVAFTGGDAVDLSIFGGLDVNTIRGTRRRAEKASYALLQATFVAMQHMNAAIARLEMYRLIRVVLRHGFPQHIAERDAKALYQRDKRFACFPDDGRHRTSV